MKKEGWGGSEEEGERKDGKEGEVPTRLCGVIVGIEAPVVNNT